MIKKKIQIQGLQQHSGWWNKIKAADLNKDGLPDLIIGNAGLNSKFKPTAENPISLYVHDFDNNGSVEQIHAYRNKAEDYPIHTRHELVKQMTFLKREFLTYADYAEKTFEIPGQTRHLHLVNTFGSHYIIAVRNNDKPIVFKTD